MVVPSGSTLRFLRRLEAGCRSYEGGVLFHQCCSSSTTTSPRKFSTSTATPSGHSRWSTIKHDKGKNDALKNKQRTLLSHAIANASRMAGPDSNSNPALHLAITSAKRAGFPKAGIEAAVLRGQGKSAGGGVLENITIEAVAPPVAMIVECSTDGKGKALQDLRFMLKKTLGARETPTAYLFERRGRVVFRGKEGCGAEEILEVALEVGGLDVEDERDVIVVETETSAVVAVEKAVVDGLGLEVVSSELVWVANKDTSVDEDGVDAGVMEGLRRLEEDLEEYSGFATLYTNLNTAKVD